MFSTQDRSNLDKILDDSPEKIMTAKKPVRRDDLCIVLNSKGSVEWCGAGEPQLSPDEAVAIGINRAADALFAIAANLAAITGALEILSQKD